MRWWGSSTRAREWSRRACELIEGAGDGTDALRDLLRIGLHWDVEVTSGGRTDVHVSQAFCSALPVSYTRVPSARWEPFARLVLEGAYEATLWAAVLNARRTAAAAAWQGFRRAAAAQPRAFVEVEPGPAFAGPWLTAALLVPAVRTARLEELNATNVNHYMDMH